MNYAEVILPLPLLSTFTYCIPAELVDSIGVGFRVLVPFGRKKFYTGIVAQLHNHCPGDYEIKNIVSVLDNNSILRHPQLKLWQWIADYYICSIGDVYRAAVPSGMKVESTTQVSANLDYIDTDHSLKERETVIYNILLTKDKLTPAEISKATGFKNVESIISSMLEKDAIYVNEKIISNYHPRTETYVRLTAEKGDKKSISRFFELVKLAKKQEAALLALLDMSCWLQKDKNIEVKKEDLIKRAEINMPILKALEAKGIVELYKKEINRFHCDTNAQIRLNELTESQSNAFDEIVNNFATKDIVLLHGVTSSGKTEIYTHLIDAVLKNGQQALYLVPEIALTTQLTNRLREAFGDRLLVYHSKFSDNERVDIWKELLKDSTPRVIIGVRSSIFLPFSDLGLIIVDEEHETSFKQQDPAPRYNARSAALVLAALHNAKTLLGSATPSIESFYNASIGKYGIVELKTRYEGAKLPLVKIIDIKQARMCKEMDGPFSNEMLTDNRNALEKDEQVIFFQNRRGFAPIVRCKECDFVPKCKNCDVSLTYHKRINLLTCHYCGYTMPLPNICPVCKQPAMEIVGYGTERIEDELEKQFPGKKIARMDVDSTRSRNGCEQIIENFSNKKMHILVGTQMVTKGLDFDGVSVVNIVNADMMLSFPDFRAHERAFNMMEQVAGRAGRRESQGLVCIQTSQPDNEVIKCVVNHDYSAFYRLELEERKKFNYPPFTRIINIYVKHRNEDVLVEMSVRFSNMLRQVFGSRILGPEQPAIGRIQQLYIRQIVLKVETSASMQKVKTILRQIYERTLSDSRMHSAIVYYDVDPS